MTNLARLENRHPFLFVRGAKISAKRENIVVESDGHTTDVPSQKFAAILLGPGTSITHEAVKQAQSNGLVIAWVDYDGLGIYSTTYKANNSQGLINQIRCFVSTNRRLAVAKRLFQHRFEEDAPNSIEQIRLSEGRLVKPLYARCAARHGVQWTGRRYRPSPDLVNQLLTLANSLLYGICYVVIVTAGYSPAIGFIHTGKSTSFVFDVADLYKEEFSIEPSFRLASWNQRTKDLRSEVAKLMVDKKLISRIFGDLDRLFGGI